MNISVVHVWALPTLQAHQQPSLWSSSEALSILMQFVNQVNVIHCHTYRQGETKQKEESVISLLRMNLFPGKLCISPQPPQVKGICEGEIMHDQHDTLLCWDDWSGECCENFWKTYEYPDLRLQMDMANTLLIRKL